MKETSFVADWAWVKRSLIINRLDQAIFPFDTSVSRLAYFIECVLVSVPDWDMDSSRKVIRIAAEISENLSNVKTLCERTVQKLKMRAAILYELADLPSLSASILKDEMIHPILKDFFVRKGPFRSLVSDFSFTNYLEENADKTKNISSLVLSSDSIQLSRYEQGESIVKDHFLVGCLADIAKHNSVELTCSELNALKAVLLKRLALSTRENVENSIFSLLKIIGFPAEFWNSQVQALRNGLLDTKYDSWGFASPTGTGKTFLARLLILETLYKKRQSKVLYIVPSRALVYEVVKDLSSAFNILEIYVAEVTPQLSELSSDEEEKLETASVVVLTPEKADLLLRLGVDFLQLVSLIVIDEAHHIESGTRGSLLELYIWRLKNYYANPPRIVFLSAVAPNLGDLTRWVGKNPRDIVLDNRSTRMRVGIYKIRNKRGIIEYPGILDLQIVSNPEKTQERQLVQLAERLSIAGPVLTVAKGKKTSQNIAKSMKKWLDEKSVLPCLTKEELFSDEYLRLDSRLEREMDSVVEMRSLIKHRIAYHHAGLPPRVRCAVEDAIKIGLIKYVFATTTLAEGVNFPFSSVIVQSLALREPPEKGRPSKYSPVTPRNFWNIAGRAGRPGYDKEGQAILFEPSLGLDKIDAVIDDYLEPSLFKSTPVESALAKALKEILEIIEAGQFEFKDFTETVLPNGAPRKVKGAVNLLRTGLIHAKATKIDINIESILEGTFAYCFLSADEKVASLKFFLAQNEVVDSFIAKDNSPPVELLAQLGLSLETVSELCNYIASLDDWKIENMSGVMHGGRLNFDQVEYLIRPIVKRMAEIEGGKLQSFMSDVVLKWLSGIPLAAVKKEAGFDSSLEELVSVIYSRVQYILPWGIYAFHCLLEDECTRRGLACYSGEVLSVAYLVDAGVSSFDAFRLVKMDFERVDATRLADYYYKNRHKMQMDVMGWLANESDENIAKILRGWENRRIDFDLPRLIRHLRGVS
ncbi:DEAD/DEAH box helicase domain protein [Solidesulfovibrio carbinoliphilus subsp. oakridgensis]|uniref:DEAD/DEAH box helicase domain protein n=1 Tax=Solidesulfovibrio carbinoliphilus subsp. oakridgensis TaxID=694327 RepID=G7Q519_9BACT|nr:DEAD/DEAH box helicase [Solidesulfovibrio carbinoliphilus]EHJ47946.1 DEAD/DEAH box helicase domain protein [Solidesulfovibrio carbinoliphilus subsp. oakridgensis]